MESLIKKLFMGISVAGIVILIRIQLLLQSNRVIAIEKNTETLELTLAGGGVTKKAFSPDQPHMVLILSYQRCGSSFFGGIFDQHPNGMYVYEPLDGLYTAMYGTPGGWNVPSDIRNWPNGTQRAIPKHESRAIMKFLGELLTCQYDKMPTQFLFHHYWGFFREFQHKFIPYTKCLGNAGVRKHYAKCFEYISRNSNSRFGENYDQLTLNQAIMWDNNKSEAVTHIDGPEWYKNYSECLTSAKMKASRCIHNVSEVCRGTHFRSTKTVRATMASVEGLITEHQNLRVIHLIRDPRAVVLSRIRGHTSMRSLHAGSNVIKEAKMFCNNLVSDIKIRKQLEMKYPGIFLEVLYDDFVLEPLNYTEKIYDFVNMTLPESVRNWVSKYTGQVKNSTYIASKWQRGLTYYNVKEITKSCQQFFDMMNYEFS